MVLLLLLLSTFIIKIYNIFNIYFIKKFYLNIHSFIIKNLPIVVIIQAFWFSCWREGNDWDCPFLWSRLNLVLFFRILQYFKLKLTTFLAKWQRFTQLVPKKATCVLGFRLGYIATGLYSKPVSPSLWLLLHDDNYRVP